jgi:Mrp family chromosome partitioning ATPase
VRERLPWVRWGAVRNGMAEIEQIAPEVLREFSTRRRQIEERERELVASGVEVRRAGREAIAHDTRARKRYGIDTAPWREVVRARAAEHGLGARELKALVRGRERTTQLPDARLVSDELAGARGLTERQNTFARREAVMAWAVAHGQGAPAAVVERAAAQFLTRRDVHRTPDADEPRFTTSDLIAHEEAIVRGAHARRSEGSGRLDGALVDTALGSVPFAPTTEQTVVVRGLTSSGHGVETVEALAGTGKTFTAGLLARAYAAGGFRVLGTAPTARAVRELQDEAGIAQAWTLTRLALDLDADPTGFGTGPAVLIVDEAGMASTRETAVVLAHAAAARVKVIAIGDSGQLSSVQAGGWLGSLTRRLGSHEFREVMRQRDPRERALLTHVRRGHPSEYLTEKTAREQLHIFSGKAEAALEAEHAVIAAWRHREALTPSGQAVMIVRDNVRRARLNALARAELQRQGRLGESVHVAGQEFAVGDRVIARRNDRLRAVDRETPPRSSSSTPQPNASSTAPRSPQTTPRSSATSEPHSSASKPPCADATTRTSPSTASTGPPNPSDLTSPSHSLALTPEATHRGVRSTRSAPNSPNYASTSPATPTPRLTSTRPCATRGPRPSEWPPRHARGSPSSKARLAGCSGAARAIRRPWHSNASAAQPPNTRSQEPLNASSNSPPALPITPLKKPSRTPCGCALPRSRPSSPSSASSTCAASSTTPRRTSPRRSARRPNNHAHAAHGSKPPSASRHTASTTPSPTPTTPSDHRPPRGQSAHIGSEHSKTSAARSASSVITSSAGPPTSSDQRGSDQPRPPKRATPLAKTKPATRHAGVVFSPSNC